MKNKTVRFIGQKRAFKITEFIYMWILLFVAAVIFTQALRNSISYVFLIIVCAILPLDLIYTVTVKFAVTATFSCSAEKAEKKEPVSFALTLYNRFILPVPFTEAELIMPDESGVSPMLYIRVPLTALGKNEFRKSVAFCYKGEYSCGIRYIYVSGLFRFFRIRIRMPEDRRSKVTVLPRRISAGALPDRYINEASTASDVAVTGTDSAEIAEIKEYVPGDPIRNIHWKLSTKVEDLMTKRYGAENGYSTCVIADQSMHYANTYGTDIEISEYCGDAVCELCCYILSTSLYEGKKAALVYFDTHGSVNRIERKRFDGAGSFDDFLPYYAACMNTEPVSASAFLGYTEEGIDNDIIYVTSRLNEDTVSALCEAQSSSRAVSLLLFEPYSMIDDPEKIKNETEACIKELTAANVSVKRISEKEFE